MTIHYHGTPITPRSTLLELAGRHFCVSHAAPQDVAVCHQIGQSVMLDNGAFSAWRSGKPTNWHRYYEWVEEWSSPTTWAVIPDIITGTAEDQDALLAEWPAGLIGAPVWHMHEPIERLARLCDDWPRVCVGSSGDYAVVGDARWHARMTAAFNRVASRRTPWLHMLRGMSLSGSIYPFASVDSTDIARNHHQPHKSAKAMADRWDAAQCPLRWTLRPEQLNLSGRTEHD